MRRYSEAVKADVRRRMSPPHRQSVACISEELGIHVVTHYNWWMIWRLQGEVVIHQVVTTMILEPLLDHSHVYLVRD